MQKGGVLVGGSLDALVEHLLPNESYNPEVCRDILSENSSQYCAFNPQRAHLCLPLYSVAGCL